MLKKKRALVKVYKIIINLDVFVAPIIYGCNDSTYWVY